MRSEFILLVIIGGFLTALVVFLIIVYKPTAPAPTLENKQAVSSDTDTINSLMSQIKWLEEGQRDLKAYVSTQSAKTAVPVTAKAIMATAFTQGGLFTTTSTSYAPMGMYVNIKCPKACLLWINFYTASKNTGASPSVQGNLNSYDVFLDEADQSIYSQASYPVASSAIPVSLNVTITASAGVHTVDIRAKTSGGTLESDSSALQVLAIER